ncbi:MAG: hypothetical protein U1C33_05985, partial [Candidatus Cloacimonadaceae bacterium]|nr:hypothetical protein [Candidatus Cloacimonadaceae bacterium]
AKLGNLSLRIHNLRGQEMHRSELEPSSITKGEQDYADLCLPRGVYLVSIYRQNQKLKSTKLTVK